MDMHLVEKIKQEIEEELDSLDNFGYYNSTSKYEFDTNGNIIGGETEFGTTKLDSGIGFKEDNNYFIEERRYAILDLIEKYSKSEEEVNTKGISSNYVLGYAVVENDIANRILKGQRVNLKSELIVENGFIGKGMYFSEGNYRYAKEYTNNNKLVIGAVINKGNTLDFTNGSGQVIVNEYYKRFIEKFQREPIDDVEMMLSS